MSSSIVERTAPTGRLKVLFLGSDEDPERALLPKLESRYKVTESANSIAAVAAAAGQAAHLVVDVVVSTVALEADTRDALARSVGLVLIRDDEDASDVHETETDDVVVLPRKGLTANVLSLGIRSALERRVMRTRGRVPGADSGEIPRAQGPGRAVLDETGVVLSACSRFAEITGLALEKIPGSRILENIAERAGELESRGTAEGEWREELLRAELHSFVGRLDRPDGTTVRVVLEATRLVAGDGKRRTLLTLRRVSSRTIAASRDALVTAEARRHFERIFEASPAGIALTTLEGIILDVNPALEALLGYSRSELVGIPSAWLAEDSGNPRQSDVKTLIRRLEDGEVAAVKRERVLRRKTGIAVHAEVSTAMVRDDDGQPIAVLLTIVDVTERHEAEQAMLVEIEERRKAEEEARNAHEFLEAALRSMPVGVLIAENPTGKAILANERFSQLFGVEAVKAETTATRAARLALKREDGSPYPTEKLPLLATLRDGKPHEATDIWFEGKDKILTPLASKAALVNVPYNGKTAAILVVQDLTAIREQERQRRVAEKRYRGLFDQATDGVLIATAAQAGIVEANPSAAKLLGYEPGELFGKPAFGFAPAQQDDGRGSDVVVAEQSELARREGVARFAWRAIRRDGKTVDVEITLQPLHLEGSPDLFIIRLRDLSKQRALEEKLRQSQKLEAIGMLAGGIAHDFNNVLTGVTGFLELAHERLPDGGEKKIAQAKKFVSEARRAANRAVELTRQLLAFGRRSNPNRKTIDLNESVDRTLSLVRRLIGEQVKLHVELAPEGCPIRGDAGELEQALLNLSINARDAMPRGGTLHVTTRRYEPTFAEASAIDLAPGKYVILEVSDSGVGMTDSVKTRLFEPFFTTKDPGRGTGLGLAVVHGVVQRHSGRIFVHSAMGEGSRFTIIFPLVLDAAGKTVAAATPGRLACGSGHVLVVDDDPMVREVTAAMLETLGYRVSKASGAAEALERVNLDPPELVITDVVMPDTSGVELERRLRAERPGLKVLLVSGYTRDAFARHGVDESGPIQLLPKPLTLEALGGKVHEMLASRPTSPVGPDSREG